MSVRLKETILLTAAYYHQDISDAVLKMYVEDLSNFDVDLVINAYTTYRRDPKNIRMPLPSQIIGILSPRENLEYKVELLTEKVIAAIKSHQESWASGYDSVYSETGKYFFSNTPEGRKTYNNFHSAFVAQLGIAGLHLLKNKHITWAELCREFYNYNNPSTFKAHLKASALTAIQDESASKPLSLEDAKEILKLEPKKERSAGLLSFGGLAMIKKLEGK